MIELVQFPWSPYCIVQRRILEYSGTRFKIVNIPPGDRTLVWKLSRQRYYSVPLLKDNQTVVFETDANSQVIAKYLNAKFNLNLFPSRWDGLQRLVWRYIEHEIEDLTFRLNDAFYSDFVPKAEHLDYIRWKERKFGPGCLQAWREQVPQMRKQLEQALMPCEQMLGQRSFLLDEQPRFVDFDLWGMLGNLLYSGQNELPAAHAHLREWHRRMSTIKSESA